MNFQYISYLFSNQTKNKMETITANIKPGPKRKKEDGTDDERQRVNPDNQPKHPKLKPHEHEKGR